jgi:transcription elongation GreA/GreB family factor
MLPLVSQVRQFIYLSSTDKNYLSLASRCILNEAELGVVIEKLERYYHSGTNAGTTGVALIGSQVMLYDYVEDVTMDVVITLPEEADPCVGRLSVLSPLGGLLLGAREGESLTLYFGNTTTQFKVQSVC